MDKVFRIKGSFKKKRKKIEFIKEIISNSKDRAVERLYSEVGSKHAVKRNMIEISEIEEIKSGNAEDPDIRSLEEE